MQPILEIFIEAECKNCDVAREIASLVRQQVPAVQVRLIDVSVPGTVAPDNVFAVPTYLINGETWSLGNPDSQELVAELKALVNQ